MRCNNWQNKIAPGHRISSDTLRPRMCHLSTWLPLTLLVAFASACDRGGPIEPSPAPKAASPATPPAELDDDGRYRMPAAERVVAIGDVHGDIAATRAALRIAGALNEKDEWIGGKLVVVQTGDQLDRGDDEPEILALFDALEKDARASGGRFYAMNGNHEVMNVAGDFRYVTEGGFSDYADVKPVGATLSQKTQPLDPIMRGRAAAFLPGGPEAKRLAKRPITLVVGDTAFAHGGILPGHLRYGLSRMNDEAQKWMRGETDKAPEILDGPTSPIWSRDFSDGQPSARSCAALGRVLSMLKVQRMVVGHTVQKDGITSGCGDRVWRIDVGMAKHYGGKPQVLEITGGKVRSLGASEVPASAPSASAGAAPRPVLVAPTRRGLEKSHASP